jgi:tetratricopeptide (TPR) repeat protein
MVDGRPIVDVNLFGQFSMHDAEGQDVTPRGKKASGLIALLAVSEPYKRSRRWIEQTLWSDRGAEQARGSLRQTLFELRRDLGPLSELLCSDRTSIWLNPGLVRVSPIQSDRVFLEGLDIADPEFQAWLSAKRLAYGAQSGAGGATDDRQVRIQCGTPMTAATPDPAGAMIMNDQVGGIISGFIAQSTRGVFETEVDLIVNSSLQEVAGRTVLAVQIVDARNDVLLHSDHSVAGDLASLLDDGPEMAQFCWKVADRALEKLAYSRRETDAVARRAAWSQKAIGAVLSFDHALMPLSLNILDHAASELEDGLFFALRAWSIMSLIMEVRLEETPETLCAVQSALQHAQRLSPDDPMVLAIIANVRAVFFEDYAGALSLSNKALRWQPNNVFATQAMALSRFNTGSSEAAYVLSRRNRSIAQATKYAAMCDLHHALLCLRTNRPEEALDASRSAAEATPGYRAPNRQLVALYAATGQLKEASTQAALLAKIEPDFALDRMLHDTSYPTNTLRASGTLSRAKQALTRGIESRDEP